MRMRKLPWAEEYIQNASIVLHDKETNKGKWKETLCCENLHVEIGTGKGDYWITMGCKQTDCGWIGIEKNTNVAALAVRKYQEREEVHPNMMFIHGDAEELENWFEKGEIDVLHLNFSDPWPKKRAHKK